MVAQTRLSVFPAPCIHFIGHVHILSVFLIIYFIEHDDIRTEGSERYLTGLDSLAAGRKEISLFIALTINNCSVADVCLVRLIYTYQQRNKSKTFTDSSSLHSVRNERDIASTCRGRGASE